MMPERGRTLRYEEVGCGRSFSQERRKPLPRERQAASRPGFVPDAKLRDNYCTARFSHSGPVQPDLPMQIGRATCRERVCTYVWISVVAVARKKKNKIYTMI